jgi:hypothetical protein
MLNIRFGAGAVGDGDLVVGAGAAPAPQHCLIPCFLKFVASNRTRYKLENPLALAYNRCFSEMRMRKRSVFDVQKQPRHGAPVPSPGGQQPGDQSDQPQGRHLGRRQRRRQR